MSKLKIEHGASRMERVKLQVSIDLAVATDIELMAQWSDNEKNYIVNELLRFALGESTEFQRHKQNLSGLSQARQQVSGAVEPKSLRAASDPASRTSEVTR